MRKLTWLSGPLLLIVLVLGACSGGEDEGDGVDATPAATGAATATAPAAATEVAGGGDGGTEALSALATQFAGATFRATYQVDGSSDGEVMTGEWTWYQDGASRFRMDFSVEGTTGTMIDVDDEFVLCAEGTCFSVPADGSGPIPNPGEALTEQVDDFQSGAIAGEVRRVDSRDIAGVEAQCFEFDDAAESSSGTVCYSDAGVPLLLESESPEGNFRMEATAFSASVSDEDFEPPFAVTSLPGS